ncbi:MAG: metal-dependent transcriptional regulator [Promethearchaeota archaeon CR_4]|nr:MAG: metal-dependent transcriptional regulator [Candidatus Lokiarchaeota archaeon CR_4]
MHEYLETILRLSKRDPGNLVTNLDIANDLNIKPPSVSEMIPKLQEHGLVEWEKRKGVKLTEKGLKLASLVTRNHVMLKVLFNKLFGIDNDSILEKLACDIEHHLTERVSHLMEDTLGTAKIDSENLKADDLAFINKLDELRVVNTTKLRRFLDEITLLLDSEGHRKESPLRTKINDLKSFLLEE